MSNDLARYLNSKRRHKTDVAISRQVKIVQSHNALDHTGIRQPHRLAKRHAMDCGNPGCFLCGNPRKTHKDRLTQQEKRLFQDVEKTSDKHSNGLPKNQDE